MLAKSSKSGEITLDNGLQGFHISSQLIDGVLDCQSVILNFFRTPKVTLFIIIKKIIFVCFCCFVFSLINKKRDQMNSIVMTIRLGH